MGILPAMKILPVTLCLALLATAAHAAPKPEALGNFSHWNAYTHEEAPGKPVCYMATPPVKSSGKYKSRGPVFLMITNRPGEGTGHVVSHVAGYPYDESQPVKADIDGTEFLMIPKADMAWTPNQKSDNILADALRKGNKLTVTGISTKGTKTVDNYSLKGAGKALDAIDKACPPAN